MSLRSNSASNSSRRRQIRRTQGFTLVELLVVVGIIIVLMSVLLPVLSSSQESARQSQCLNRLRQLGSVFQKTQMNVGNALKPANLKQYMDTYLAESEEVWLCPDTEIGKSSYGFNSRMHRLHDLDTYKILALDYAKDEVAPEAGISVADVVGAPQTDRNGDGSVNENDVEWEYAARHRGRVNVLFYAGNVELRTQSAVNPRTCWIHENHWRPEIDVAYVRAAGECEVPPGHGGGVPPDTGQDDEEEEQEPEPEDCDISPKMADDNSALFRGVMANPADDENNPNDDTINAWTEESGGFGGKFRTTEETSDSVNAQWTFTLEEHSLYQLSMTWVSGADRSTQVTVLVFDGGTTETTPVKSVEIDQTQEPIADITRGGRPFEHLGDPIEIKNGALTVLMKTDAPGVIVADAFRLSCEGDDSDDDINGTGGGGPGEEEEAGPELVLHYKFDDPQDPCLDSSDQQNHGFSLGAQPVECNDQCDALPDEPTPGGCKAALQFSGEGDFAEVASFKLGGDITVACWLMLNKIDDAAIIDFGSGNGTADRILLGITPLGSLYMRINSQEATAANFFDASADVGTWVHVTATVSDTGSVTFYKNGSAAGSGVASVVANTARGKQTLGSNNAGLGFLDGLMDDLRIYNIEKQASDIANWAQNSPGDCQRDIEIWLPFQDTTDPYIDRGAGPGDYDGTPQGLDNDDVKACDTNRYLKMEGSQSVVFGRLGLGGKQSVTAMAWIKVLGPTLIDDPTNPPASFVLGSGDGFDGDYYQDPTGARRAGAAEYVIENISPGAYTISAHWPAVGGSSSADWYIYNDRADGTSEQIASSSVNQTAPPSNNVNVNGKPFQTLISIPADGVNGFTSGSLRFGWLARLNPGILADAIHLAPANAAGTPPGGPIFGFGSGSRGFAFGTSDTGLVMKVGDADIFASANGLFNQWVHVAGVYDSNGREVRLYLNGTLVYTESDVSANFSDSNYALGKFASDKFNGDIDNFRLYSRVVADGEILKDSGCVSGP